MHTPQIGGNEKLEEWVVFDEIDSIIFHSIHLLQNQTMEWCYIRLHSIHSIPPHTTNPNIVQENQNPSIWADKPHLYEQEPWCCWKNHIKSASYGSVLCYMILWRGWLLYIGRIGGFGVRIVGGVFDEIDICFVGEVVGWWEWFKRGRKLSVWVVKKSNSFKRRCFFFENFFQGRIPTRENLVVCNGLQQRGILKFYPHIFLHYAWSFNVRSMVFRWMCDLWF